MQTRLCVDGLPEWMTSARLKDLCSTYGGVVSAYVVRDMTGRSLAFGFVEMATPAQVDHVIHALDGTDRFGSMLHVTRTMSRVFDCVR